MTDKPEVKTFDDGGPAFPSQERVDSAEFYEAGASLWALFAGLSMMGESARYSFNETDLNETARRCGRAADAVIAEMRRRERGE